MYPYRRMKIGFHRQRQSENDRANDQGQESRGTVANIILAEI